MWAWWVPEVKITAQPDELIDFQLVKAQQGRHRCRHQKLSSIAMLLVSDAGMFAGIKGPSI